MLLAAERGHKEAMEEIVYPLLVYNSNRLFLGNRGSYLYILFKAVLLTLYTKKEADQTRILIFCFQFALKWKEYVISIPKRY